MIKKIYIFILFAILLSNNIFANEKNIDLALPIEINADNMMVDQQQAVAVLSGNVEASQGDIQINSDIMKIYYKNNGKNLDNNSITRIEVEGNVVMKTKKEYAKSHFGIYDLTDGIVTLSSNVTLMQNNNIIKGEKLVYNVKNGKSKVTNASGKNVEDQQTKRVKAIFKTDDLKN